MSSYTRITKHPVTGNFEEAQWIDNYFGEGSEYVVKFPDGAIFRESKHKWEFQAEKDMLNICKEDVKSLHIQPEEVTPVDKLKAILDWMDEYHNAFRSAERWRQELEKFLKTIL